MSHQSAESIFYQARAMPPAERDVFLKGACAGDVGLRAKVDALLKAESDAGSFLKTVAPEGDGGAEGDAPGRGNGVTIASPGAEQPGQMIGRYKLLQPIGEGGFGTVWMAEQREPVKRRVALKIIKLGMDTKQVIARFEAERQALAMMDHPNIARVLDAGATETGRPYFVMEYIRGVPILDYCDTGKLDTKARLELFIQVCHAIQHAHQKGIIHRDIKPSNVLVTLHDGVPVPKVIDFGIAKATNAELTERTLFTQHRQMIGTPAYMSPEQAEMSGLDIDTRSDVYSLGVLLYELLTGTTPFDGEELMSRGFAEMMRIIREVEPHKPSTRLSTLGQTATRTAEQRRADPRKLGLNLRGDLDWIVMKCLEKDRSRRYETANGLAMDIRRHLDDQPVAAGPPTAHYRLRKLIRRNKGACATAAIVFLALALGMAGTTVGMVRSMDAERKATRELTRANEVKLLITTMLHSVAPEHARGADTTLLREILDRAAERLAHGEVKDKLVAAELHHLLGSVYWSLSEFEPAEAHTRRALEIRRNSLGPSHRDTLGSMHNLTSLMMEQSRYAEAEPLYRELLAIWRRTNGRAHEVAGIMNNLGILESRKEAHASAEALYKEALSILHDLNDDEDLLIADCLLNLGTTYAGQSRFDEAEAMYHEAISAYGRVDTGAAELGALSARAKLAEAYMLTGRFSEAEPILLETLRARERILGENHDATISTLNDLAALSLLQSRPRDGAMWCQAAYDRARRFLPREHEEAMRAMGNLGLIRLSTGELDEAERLCRETLELSRRVRGELHSNTLGAKCSLASVYRAQGRTQEGLDLALEAGNTHKALELVADFHAQLGHWDEAEAAWLELLGRLREELGPEHRRTLGTITNIGHFYARTDRLDDACAMYEMSLPAKQRVLGEQDPWTRIARTGLSHAYAGLGRLEDALRLEEEQFRIDLSLAADADASTLNGWAWHRLRCPFEQLRSATFALPLAEQACAKEARLGGPSLWTYLDTLALAQHMTGDSVAATETQRRALALMPEDQSDSEMLQRLAEYQAAAGLLEESSVDDLAPW